MFRRPPFQIKICGITRPLDAVAAVRAGADAIGLNFYSGSSRFVDFDRARTIVEAVETTCQSGSKSPALNVGVFVNSSASEIAEIAAKCRLDAVQFHGQESCTILHKLAPDLWNPKNGNRLTTIRVIRIPAAEPHGSKLENSVLDRLAGMIQEALEWRDAGVDAILFDAAVPGEFGGSGKTVDWSLVRKFEAGLPVVLAGGLNPNNVAAAIQEAGVQGVDVASGVESSPGIKDERLMREFVYRSRLQSGFDNLTQI